MERLQGYEGNAGMTISSLNLANKWKIPSEDTMDRLKHGLWWLINNNRSTSSYYPHKCNSCPGCQGDKLRKEATRLCIQSLNESCSGISLRVHEEVRLSNKYYCTSLKADSENDRTQLTTVRHQLHCNQLGLGKLIVNIMAQNDIRSEPLWLRNYNPYLTQTQHTRRHYADCLHIHLVRDEFTLGSYMGRPWWYKTKSLHMRYEWNDFDLS